jgi:predicted nucleic acid-binding protein
MEPVFADTWFFVALADPFDSHHARAVRLNRAMRQSALLLHDAILTEVLAFFSAQGASFRARAVESVRHALRQHDVVNVDQRLFQLALDLYAARPDKEYSLVDCMSMTLMKQRGITHILTTDHHFRQEGFTVLSGAP